MIAKYRPIDDLQYIVADTETTGLDWHTDRVFGVATCTPLGETNYYSMRNELDEAWVKEELPRARRIVNHHIKFDIHMLWSSGTLIDPARCTCTMISAALLDEHEDSYGLDALARKYTGVGKDERVWDELAVLFGGKPTRKDQIGNLHRAPVELAARYAMQDAFATNKLWQYQEPLIRLQGLERVFKVEHDLLRVLVHMERHGVGVDAVTARANVGKLKRRQIEAQRMLDHLAGTKLNVNSGPQVNKLLVKEKLDTGEFMAIDGITVFPATDSGKSASILSEQLRRMQHPVAQAIVELRSLGKTIDTFLNGHILDHEYNGRIYCNYNQTKSDNDLGTGTGRISINKPPLQQINKRDKYIAPYVRGCFVPDEDHWWWALDWSQMDFRIFAHYSKSPPVIAAYTDDPDADFHEIIAQLTNIPRDRTPGTGGGNAKQINLGMVFGMSAGRMAQEMGLEYHKETTRAGNTWLRPGEQAEAVFAKYHDAVPGVRELLASASALAKDRGFVKTALGRRIRFPGGQFTHKAAGLVFQGTAADCLKVKLVEVFGLIQGTDAKLLLNVHDEFDLSMPKDETAEQLELRHEIVACVERFGPDDAIPLRVPIRCSASYGPNWWVASGEAPDHSALYRVKPKRAGRREK